MTAADTLPWVEKYRPSTVEEVLSHGDIIMTLTKLADGNKLPHLLLYGPAGTGKTSTVMAVAKRIYGDQIKSNILELNASDDRGIDVVRHQIKDFASTKQLFGNSHNYKLVVLDEADQMTNEAQAALRRVIELYTRNVRFCIICNYVNKILPAIQSRCTRFRFGPLPKKMVVSRLQEIVEIEKIPFSTEALGAVYKLSSGDMRKGVNILQGASMSIIGDEEITAEAVYDATGSPSPETMRKIVEVTMMSSLKESLLTIRNILTEKGLALQDVIREIHPWISRMVMKNDLRCWAIDKLSSIEHELSFSCNDKLQILSLVSMLQLVRISITEDKHISSLCVKGYMEE